MSFPEEDLRWAARCVPAWKRFVKRALDIAVCLFLAPAALLFLAAAALIIKAGSPGPVFFCQERVGYLGRKFKLWKLRTMAADALKQGGYETGARDPRITAAGRFLRRWALDETPQLWNVFKGEMSLVGPRPTMAYQVEKYSDLEKRRLLMPPGMTGLAQVSGRNKLTWPEKIELDIQYIGHYSLTRDLVVLLRTAGLIWSAEGVYGDSGV